jgi:molecular chaperone GrpE
MEDAGEQLKKCEQEKKEYLEGWQRAKADFVNYKRDEAARLTTAIQFASEDLFMELIAVLDSFDLGIAAMEKQGGVEKGVYMIRTQLEDALRRRGLERIAVSAGEPFNPSVAEAVAESESERAPGCIVEEIERGYTLHGKVLRPARVKISKGQIKQ